MQRRSELDAAESRDKRHGRREHRRLESSTRLASQLSWPGVAQVCRIIRTTWRGGKQSTEVQYAITSVPRSQGSAAQLLDWWRGHWGIENRLHWIRDVVFGEDRCRIRSGSAPQNMAAFRNAVISLLHFLGPAPITKTLRQHARRVDLLLAKFGISNL